MYHHLLVLALSLLRAGEQPILVLALALSLLLQLVRIVTMMMIMMMRFMILSPAGKQMRFTKPTSTPQNNMGNLLSWGLLFIDNTNILYVFVCSFVPGSDSIYHRRALFSSALFQTAASSSAGFRAQFMCGIACAFFGWYVITRANPAPKK